MGEREENLSEERLLLPFPSSPETFGEWGGRAAGVPLDEGMPFRIA